MKVLRLNNAAANVETGIQDPSGASNIPQISQAMQNAVINAPNVNEIANIQSADVYGLPNIGLDTSLSAAQFADTLNPQGLPVTPSTIDQDAGMGAAIAANDGFNVTVGNPVTGASANVADLGVDAVGTGTGVNTVETPSFVSGMDAVDATISPISETDAFLGDLTTGAGVTTPSGTMGAAIAESLMGAPLSGSGGYDIGIGDGASMNATPLGMSPAKAQAMTGGSMSTTNNTGMNLAQQTDNIEAEKQAAAMDVLGAQIGAGNLTGNEDIDEVNQELAKQGVQIDTSGLPSILGTGVNALNQNYQLNQNQDILTQLAQGSNAPNTGILGTGIGAVENVNTYQPAYNAQGQIVGSVAVDAAGNPTGGPAGITTNVVGGIGSSDFPELFSDAAGTQTFTGANEAVSDFKEMAAASKSSDEGPPEDVTSVDANGCRIGSEFFNGQRCQPIETNTGDGTGGATGGGAYTPYQYQPGQGTMLRPDFSDMYTSNVQFNTLNPGASNMNFLKPAVNPYGNFAGGGIVPMMRNYSVR
jgi:hypothetical protein